MQYSIPDNLSFSSSIFTVSRSPEIYTVLSAMAALTHPEWNQETGGLEVAKAFADQIRGKNGSFA